MEPIILIHGYSAENKPEDSIDEIYGSLRADLNKTFAGSPVVGIDVTRYISLDDGVDLDDLSLSFDRALRARYPKLNAPDFDGINVIIHSTGALVIRNWIRRHSPKPSPIKRIIHLAGANLGSGWAHIGETQLVKWARFMGHEGEQRGLAVLTGLELGSNWTIELHRHFLSEGNDMLTNYGVMEFNIVGSQVPAQWMVVPFRYGKEDGSDGVVRVSASNLNFNYLHVVPTEPNLTDWKKASDFSIEATEHSFNNEVMEMKRDEVFGGGYYTVKEDCRPGVTATAGSLTRSRNLIPFAIPYQCAHSSDDFGIVYGSRTRKDVLPLIKSALTCAPNDYEALATVFDEATQSTYDRVLDEGHEHSELSDGRNKGILAAFGNALESIFQDARAQYDKHAQLVVRVRDQNGKPVTNFSVHFNSQGGDGKPSTLIDSLFEDKHINTASHNIITFYLRTDAHDKKTNSFSSRLAEVQGVDLEIDALDEQTRRILFVPFRMRIPHADLMQWIQPHRTTIIDVELLRLPSDQTFELGSV